MQLVYGTGNNAKLDAMKGTLKELGIEVVGIKELDYSWPEIDECGNDPLENARIKAIAYYNICKRPLFSCDSGLYIDGLEDEEQPGVHVRNINGRRLDDYGMLIHYSDIAKRLGGKCTAGYRNAICLVINENEIYEYIGDDISGEKFELIEKPHDKLMEGFPLDSLSVHIKTGKYYYDMKSTDVVDSTLEGFRNFFRKVLKL